ncbi:hypothetical protein [Aquirhabdus parva]|uniref:Right-handed parallel beta-helix repeat-containing protein n=1 Tax=Aquirhabdus parva TaxID=2283318 RepID=A0A345P8Y1_9GAMM|nr:hypothetical protein [Aquirhabdus parva]AXI03740.1 hypothetical protein HYN46_13395 [Aquirhabdus parva]
MQKIIIGLTALLISSLTLAADVTNDTAIPAGGSVSSTIGSLTGRLITPKDFGAKADRIVIANGGSITSGSTSFTGTTASFVSGDIGKTIGINGAGTSNGSFFSKIVSVSSPTNITIADPAQSTVTNTPYTYATDDSTSVQNAINASSNKTLYLGNYTYCVSNLNVTGSVTIIGPTKNISNSGFVNCAANQNILTFATTSNGAILKNVFIYAGNGGVTTAGTAISALGTLTAIEDVLIAGPCIGFDVAGNNVSLNRIQVMGMPPQSSDFTCGGIRIGHTTTQGGTIDPHITNSLIQASGTGFGMRIEDCGGCWVGRNDILSAAGYNTWIIPGLNQHVDWGNFVDTVLSDTPKLNGVFIDTADSTAKIQGLQFTGTWASNAGVANSGGTNIIIRNSAGGLVNGLHFVSHRSEGNSGGGNSIDVAGSVNNFSLVDSQVCGYNSARTGVYIQDSVQNFQIRNNVIGGTCDGYASTGASGVTIVSNNGGGIITGNDLRANTEPLNLGSLVDSSYVIKDNLGVDDIIPNITSASIIAPKASSTINLTGSATVNGIRQGWQNRQLTIATPNSILFQTGGSSGLAICNNYTSTAGVPVIATYINGCWMLK